jgi:hypothetical protein
VLQYVEFVKVINFERAIFLMRLISVMLLLDEFFAAKFSSSASLRHVADVSLFFLSDPICGIELL